MTSVGEFIQESMREAPPGIKGTESASLGAWLVAREREHQQQKVKKPWYQWLDPRKIKETIGDLIIGRQKPLKPRKPLTSWEKRGLEMRGFRKEDYSRKMILDMGAILESKDLKCTSAEMADELRKLGYSDDEIKGAGVKTK